MFVSPSVGADYTHCSAQLGNKAVGRYQVLQRIEYNEEIELQRCCDCSVLLEHPVWRKWSQTSDRLIEIFKKAWIFRSSPFNCLQYYWMFISLLLVFVCVTGLDLRLCVVHQYRIITSNSEQDQNEMYLSFSRYCNLHFRCKVSACVFGEVISEMSCCPSEAIINCYKFNCHDQLIERLSVATEIGVVKL